MTGAQEGLFERVLEFPESDAHSRFARLVGIDDQKSRLTKILSILVNPAGLQTWARKHHEDSEHLIDIVGRRPPLIILAGDVGCGKTELAETVGDAVARQEGIDITLYPLSLATRGQGRVGEMTQLISSAFAEVSGVASKARTATKKTRRGVILLVDEADALAQSREANQMHHEDRAGVNAFIRGIDRVAAERMPIAVIMCTNRLLALDPAVQRRAADILTFERPGIAQRTAVLESALQSVGFSVADVNRLVDLTGPRAGREYGFTFSDLTQRLLPSLVLDAYPTSPIRVERALELATTMAATPPFKDSAP